MPQNWKTYKLGELYDSASGLSKSRAEFGFGNPFVTFKNVFYNYFLPDELSELANTNEKEVQRSSVLKGDLLLTRTSETLHELGMSSVALKDYPLATFNGFCKRLRLKNDIEVQIDPVFMGFYLRSSKFRSEVSKHSTMTTRASLNNESIASLEINLPPYNEQVQIGEILKSLLDKIELNLQMNKTLEEMAMTLYKHWFVDFEFPSFGGVAAGRGGSFPSSGGVDFIEDERRGGSFSSPAEVAAVRGGSFSSPAVRGGRNTTNYMSLPYNPKLKERAKALRKAGNLAEVLFWQQVNKKQFMGLDFDRQKIIGNYIVDFYCANVNVVVEIDGSSHDNKQDYDAARDAYLEGLGLTVIHITDEAVKKDLAQTMEDLKAHPAFNSPPPEGSAQQGEVNSPPPEGWISSEMKDGVVLSPLQQESPQGEVNSPPLEESPQGEVVNNHPAFQAPLQGRGRGSAEVKGYKSSGGKFIDSELGPIPEGWEVKELGNEFDITIGRTPPRKEPEWFSENHGIKWVSIKDMGHSGAYIFNTSEYLTHQAISSKKVPVVPENTVMLSFKLTVGRVAISTEKMATNEAIAHFSKDSNTRISSEQLYLALKSFDYDSLGSTSSIATAVNSKTVKSMRIVIPSEEVCESFQKEVVPLFKMIKNNSCEIETLTSLRETLLPKLISGEVRVKDVESQVAEVL